jgi:hypothetical protein
MSDDRPHGAGSGIVDHYQPVAVYSVDALRTVETDQPPHQDEKADQREAQPTTLGEWMAREKPRVAEIAGVDVDDIDLKVEIRSHGQDSGEAHFVRTHSSHPEQPRLRAR